MKKQTHAYSRIIFWIGILLALIIVASYFITFRVDSGFNYTTNERLLGILIFHNPFVLALYCLVIVVLLVKGLNRNS